MPKEWNKRKFLKSIRNSASPLSISSNGDGHGNGTTFSVSDHQEFSGMKNVDLMEVIQSRLKHSLPSERCVGADMISSFITLKRCSQLKSNQLTELIKILSVLLLDRAENVRYASLNALCYLSTLSDNTCQKLVEYGLCSSIMSMMEEYYLQISSWTEHKFTDRKLSLNLYVNCFNLLTNLCGESSKSIESMLTYSRITEIFHKAFLTIESYDKFNFIPIAISAAQCLMILCEDERAYEVLLKDNSENNLSSMLSIILSQDILNVSDETLRCLLLYLKSLLISIASFELFKRNNKENEEQKNVYHSAKTELITKLSAIMELCFGSDGSNFISQTIGQLTERIKVDLSSEKKDVIEIQPLSERIIYFYRTRSSCIELLTNLLSPEDEDESDHSPNDDQEDEDDCDEEMITDDENCSNSLNLDPLIVQFCQSSNIISRLIQQINLSGELNQETEAILLTHSYGRDVCSTVKTVKISTLCLIHNLISTGIYPQSDPIISSIWEIINEIVFKTTFPDLEDIPILMEKEIEIREEAINLIREYVTKFKNVNILMSELESLCFFAHTNDDRISCLTKINIIRIMALISTSYVNKWIEKKDDSVGQHIEKITNLLLNGYRSNPDLVLRAEVLDSLIDIYSDDNSLTNKIIKNMNLLSILNDLSSQYRREIKSNRVLRQNAVVNTVSLNLNRFIKYKQKAIR